MPKDYMAPDGDDSDAGEAGKPEDSSKSENTALLPKSFFSGKEFEVGSTACVKIVAIHGDEIEVEADSEKKSEDENSQEDSPEMSGAMGKIDSLAA